MPKPLKFCKDCAHCVMVTPDPLRSDGWHNDFTNIPSRWLCGRPVLNLLTGI